MTKVSISAAVSVTNGPRLSVGSEFDVDTYHVGGGTIEAGDNLEIDLLPADGHVALLAIRALDAGGKAAKVSVTPANDATDGDAFDVIGSLLVANPGVLAGLVADGPRTLKVENPGTVSVTVSALGAVTA